MEEEIPIKLPQILKKMTLMHAENVRLKKQIMHAEEAIQQSEQAVRAKAELELVLKQTQDQISEVQSITNSLQSENAKLRQQLIQRELLAKMEEQQQLAKMKAQLDKYELQQIDNQALINNLQKQLNINELALNNVKINTQKQIDAETKRLTQQNKELKTQLDDIMFRTGYKLDQDRIPYNLYETAIRDLRKSLKEQIEFRDQLQKRTDEVIETARDAESTHNEIVRELQEDVQNKIKKVADPLREHNRYLQEQYDTLISRTAADMQKIVKSNQQEHQQLIQSIEIFRQENITLQTKNTDLTELSQKQETQIAQISQAMQAQKRKLETLTHEKVYLQMILQDYQQEQQFDPQDILISKINNERELRQKFQENQLENQQIRLKLTTLQKVVKDKENAFSDILQQKQTFEDQANFYYKKLNEQNLKLEEYQKMTQVKYCEHLQGLMSVMRQQQDQMQRRFDIVNKEFSKYKHLDQDKDMLDKMQIKVDQVESTNSLLHKKVEILEQQLNQYRETKKMDVLIGMLEPEKQEVAKRFTTQTPK
ncbi:Hypothetical_protein [Hexamita inflata]|uniref:Hypothetical_protein n=2 Tax=Hexamita inflata TaxID=28002 RepID=A0AA86RG94_9EUKA|nr:Hypothetical protein HINF_LOCUS59917 [Hexamita inflata]